MLPHHNENNNIDGPIIPQEVASNAAVKTDEVFTDDENNNVDGPITPQEVASNVAVKTDEVFTDDENNNVITLNIDTHVCTN